jgi:hypothetical protein
MVKAAIDFFLVVYCCLDDRENDVSKASAERYAHEAQNCAG